MNFSPESFLLPVVSHRSQSWGVAANNSAAIDMQKYRQSAWHVHVGVIGASGTVDFKVQESADGSTGWADVSGAATAQIVASDTGALLRVKHEGRKRYLRGVLTIGVAASQAHVECVQVDPIDSLVPSAATWVKA